MCVNFRALNNATVKDRFPLPRISDCLDAFHSLRYFTKINLTSGFWQLKVKEEDQHKTAFNTRQGKYYFKVMPFSLCNAPASFQSLINKALRKHLYKTCIVYLDDIVIFSETLEEHEVHLKEVLDILRLQELYYSPKKCYIRVKEFDFYRHRVSYN